MKESAHFPLKDLQGFFCSLKDNDCGNRCRHQGWSAADPQVVFVPCVPGPGPSSWGPGSTNQVRLSREPSHRVKEFITKQYSQCLTAQEWNRLIRLISIEPQTDESFSLLSSDFSVNGNQIHHFLTHFLWSRVKRSPTLTRKMTWWLDVWALCWPSVFRTGWKRVQIQVSTSEIVTLNKVC